MSVSSRHHILVPTQCPDPVEPTSTLVLTTPGGTFVDTRLFLAPHHPDHHHQRPLSFLPNGKAYYAHPPSSSLCPLPAQHDRLQSTDDSAALDWAFAGHATRAPRPDGRFDCSWRHAVDSRTPDAASVRDEAVCEPVAEPDGAHWERETGAMRFAGPHDEPYEEGWLDLPLTVERVDSAAPVGPGGGARVDLLEGTTTTKTTTVLALRRDDGQGCGFVVRLGCWVQGVARVAGGGVAVDRWGFWPRGEEQASQWRMLGRVGSDASLSAACAFTMALQEEEVKVGDVVADGRWTVTEMQK